MVKKIKLDFSKVEERAGWNTRQMTEGLHAMKIVSVEDKEASDGTDMWVFALVPESPKYKTRRFPYYCKLQQNQLWKLRDLFVAAGVAVPKRAQLIDPTKVVGKVIAAEVEDESNPQFAGRSTVNGTYSLDLLDEQDVADDSEDDEEYEGDEEAEEEYEEDDSDDADEDEEEYEDEDDEDDLDDEDLEDEEDEDYEDEEDEEEEPEPAPRKRAPAKKPAPAAKKAAPAKKAPAKAAPARRVVKRR